MIEGNRNPRSRDTKIFSVCKSMRCVTRFRICSAYILYFRPCCTTFTSPKSVPSEIGAELEKIKQSQFLDRNMKLRLCVHIPVVAVYFLIHIRDNFRLLEFANWYNIHDSNKSRLDRK